VFEYFAPWRISGCLSDYRNVGKKKIKKKVKLSHHRPLGFQEVEAPRISRQSARVGGKVVSPMHRPPLPPRKISWYSFQ
jgi:hypothetical protein